MGAGMEGQRQLHDVFEVIRQHRLTLAMGQPIGVKGHGGATADGEQAESRPGRQQRPCRRGPERPRRRLAGQDIDDTAEQHRLGELRAGQQQIGAGQDPAQPCLLAEQFKNAGIEAKQGHTVTDSGGQSGRSFGCASNQGSPGRYSVRA